MRRAGQAIGTARIGALRGTCAFAGSVEAVGIYRRDGKDPGASSRQLEVYSRIGPSHAHVVRRTMPDGGGEPFFEVVPELSVTTAGGPNADGRVVAAIGSIWGGARRALVEATGYRDRVLDERLPRLVSGGKLVRRGCGKAGAQFEYAIPGTASDEAPGTGSPRAVEPSDDADDGA